MTANKTAKGRPDVPARHGKPRRRGYRGYGSGFTKGTAAYGGTVHWGRGFTGVEFPAGTSSTLPQAGLFKERTSRS